jgi:large subunit ribosomal protein L4
VADVKAPLFKSDGTRNGDIKLDAEVFGIEPNLDVLHQVITAQLAAARAGTASTKTRGEVRGGGRKPWRQKGLGRARHGSIRSPQWSGGGVAHGPKPRDYTQRTPKKMKRLALRSALSARASEEAIKVVEEIDWATPKTSQAAGLLKAMELKGNTVLVVSQLDSVAGKSFRNLAEVRIVEPGHLTPYDVLWSDNMVFTSHTVGAVGRKSSYEVSASDFIKDEAGSPEPESTAPPSTSDFVEDDTSMTVEDGDAANGREGEER